MEFQEQKSILYSAAHLALAYKRCCTTLLERIPIVNRMDESIFNDIHNYFLKLQNKSYFSENWMKIDDGLELECLLHRVQEGAKFDPEILAEGEEELKYLMTLSNKPRGLYETFIFEDDMLSKLEFLRNPDPIVIGTDLNVVNMDLLVYDNKNQALGAGGFGAVFKGRLRGVDVAVKIANGFTEANCQALKNEASILLHYGFPGVIRQFGVDDNLKPKLMVMELAVYSLFTFINSGTYNQFCTIQRMELLLSCCGTFAFLHSLGIIHRDITSKNILIMSNGDVKVSDFGLSKSKVVQNSAGEFAKGTVSYRAPELIFATSTYVYSEATDMYSFGVLMNEVMTGESPNQNDMQVFNLMYRTNGTERPRLYDGPFLQITSLIMDCWDRDPSKRWEFWYLSWAIHVKLPFDESTPYGDITLVDNVFQASSFLGGYYTGEMVGKKRHGKGTLCCLNGVTYEGMWRNNEMHGEGVRTGKHGSVYRGSHRHSRRYGLGEYTAADGSVYFGYWREGLKHGHGIQIASDQSVYDGEWNYGMPMGHCCYWAADGSMYYGSWNNGVKSGFGKLYAFGSVYEGQWKNSMRNGQGTYSAADKSVYSGAWKDDKKHGTGEYKYVNGDVYNGEWKDDKQHGTGEYKYVSGKVYNGEWKDDKKHGTGEYKYVGGDVYNGEWKDDKKHGTGEYKYVNGDVYNGEWKDNKRHGTGEYKFVNGDVYNGEWKDDKQHGTGKCKYVNGDVYNGEWKDNKKHGTGEYKFVNGKVYKGEWKDNKRHGTGEYKSDGKVYKGEWKNDVKVKDVV